MLEALIVPCRNPVLPTSEVLAACRGEAGAHQLLHKSSQLPSRGRWLSLLGLSQCKQAQTRSLRPLGSSKKMEIMHFDFILGAVCLALGMAAVNQPKALPCMAWEMLVGPPPAPCTHPAWSPHQCRQHSLHGCPALGSASLFLEPMMGKYSLGHLTVPVKQQGWD